ncbi:ribonuclease HI [Cyanobium sp. ATX 6A2]|uniref:ribonuclease H family protein n=1 Tax=Cyanobium sp. ATX 6A2 TaxID=2823700 RepID=UPI0020CF76A2|nr:ribonuclease H [Cyanobium sp. ATX 6A2]MCP9888768.1 ribonuclease HI [Cyanobium sp. ATX 6A2]
MAEEPVRVVAAACDGACSGNPGPGGWGALLRFEDGTVRELGGAAAATTNNRMELTAALALMEALRALPRHPDLVIRTDSRYLIDGLERWIHGWKRKGWRTASGGAVLNRDLWEQLDRARLADVTLRHVRGHSGDPDNDRCDAIAVAFSRAQRPRLADGSSPVVAPPAADPASDGVASDPVASDTVESEQAPPELRRLLSRLELADRLARGDHGLSLVELAQLVQQPLSRLERRRAPWTWRDWQVEPLADGRWRLRRGTSGLPQQDQGQA